MAERVGQGGTIRLDGMYRDATGALVEPGLPRLDVIDADGLERVTDAVPVLQALGTYYYDYSVPLVSPLGIWRAHWTGMINGVPVAADDLFEVVAAGSVVFTPTKPWPKPAELATHLGVTYDASLDTRYQQALDSAVATIRNEAAQYIDRTVDDIVELSGVNRQSVWLPERPVLNVAEVKVNGVVQATTDYTWSRFGELRALGSWEEGLRTIQIRYEHGYDPIPADLRSVCLQLAGRIIENPVGVAQESIGNYQVTYTRGAETGLTDAERRVVRRYRMTAASVSVGT